MTDIPLPPVHDDVLVLPAHDIWSVLHSVAPGGHDEHSSLTLAWFELPVAWDAEDEAFQSAAGPTLPASRPRHDDARGGPAGTRTGAAG